MQTKEEKSVYQKKWAADNKKSVYLRNKLYRQENPEVLRKKKKEYYNQNKQSISDKIKNHSEAKKEYLKEGRRIWAINNPKYYSKRAKEKVKEITDEYVIAQLSKSLKLIGKEKKIIPDEAIQSKRTTLLIKRHLKNQKDATTKTYI